MVALQFRHHSKPGERVGKILPILHLPPDCHALVKVSIGLCILTLDPGHDPGCKQCLCPPWRAPRRFSEGQRPCEPLASLADMSSKVPEPCQGCCQVERSLHFSMLLQPHEGSAQVVVLPIQPLQPEAAICALNLRLRHLRKALEKVRVIQSNTLHLA